MSPQPVTQPWQNIYVTTNYCRLLLSVISEIYQYHSVFNCCDYGLVLELMPFNPIRD